MHSVPNSLYTEESCKLHYFIKANISLLYIRERLSAVPHVLFSRNAKNLQMPSNGAFFQINKKLLNHSDSGCFCDCSVHHYLSSPCRQPQQKAIPGGGCCLAAHSGTGSTLLPSTSMNFFRVLLTFDFPDMPAAETYRAESLEE